MTACRRTRLPSMRKADPTSWRACGPPPAIRVRTPGRRRRLTSLVCVAGKRIGAGKLADIGLVGDDTDIGRPAMQMEGWRLEVEARRPIRVEIERHLMG